MSRRTLSFSIALAAVLATTVVALAPTVDAVQPTCTYRDPHCPGYFCVWDPVFRSWDCMTYCDPAACDPCFTCDGPANTGAPTAQCTEVVGVGPVAAGCVVGDKTVAVATCQWCLPAFYVRCSEGTQGVGCQTYGIDVVLP